MPIAAPLNQFQTRWMNGSASFSASLLTASFSLFTPTFTGDYDFSSPLLIATFNATPSQYQPIITTGNENIGQFLPILGVGS